MKKILSIIVLLLFLMSFLASCDLVHIPFDPSDDSYSIIENDSVEKSTSDRTEGVTDAVADGENEQSTEKNPPNNTEGNTENNTEGNTEGNTESNTEGNTDKEDTSSYLYNDFTPSEKIMFTDIFGEVIPFVPNNEYYVKEYTYDGERGINFYTLGNSQSEFNKYRKAFSSYTLVDTYEDSYGDIWFSYQKGEYYVDISYYVDEGEYYINVYAYILTDGEGGGNTGDGTHLYTDFTSEEKQMFISLFGEVIPFIPNSEYSVDEYTFDDETVLNFYTYGNTQAEFEAYLDLFSDYTLTDTAPDEYGDTVYSFEKGDYYLDVSYYETELGPCIDIYVFILGEVDSGNNGDDQNTDIITNDGKGLPEGTNGVYDVNFKDAVNVKDVTDQGYYLDGCPTTGSPGVLVIPIEFSDVTAQSRGYDISVLANAFVKGGNTDYYSVYDYYNISSYGQLELDITVLDYWFRPRYTSEYYQNATMNINGSQVAIGDQMVMDEALAYLEDFMDLSKFDSDNNGIIDAVVLITTLEIGDDDFHWAYRYWNIYTDSNEQYYEYDGVSANDYLWASYQFLNQSYDIFGNENYDDTDAVNTYTFIHEFGHILGADDYYDTSGIEDLMGGFDIMDSMAGDHNAFTKINFGWITTSRLVTTDNTVTLTLEDFSKNGDTIIVADNWDSSLGAYQEYYILMYYKSVGLNSGAGGYFERDGVLIYHVNASLYSENISGEVYYDIYNNNTDPSDEYGTEDDLIKYILSDSGSYTHVEGDVTNNNTYGIFIDSVSDDSVTITFSKILHPIID